jgi:Na+-driven multidrug efflux pump
VPMGMHGEGVFLSFVIAEVCVAAAGMVLFRQGRWARQKI